MYGLDCGPAMPLPAVGVAGRDPAIPKLMAPGVAGLVAAAEGNAPASREKAGGPRDAKPGEAMPLFPRAGIGICAEFRFPQETACCCCCAGT